MDPVVVKALWTPTVTSLEREGARPAVQRYARHKSPIRTALSNNVQLWSERARWSFSSSTPAGRAARNRPTGLPVPAAQRQRPHRRTRRGHRLPGNIHLTQFSQRDSLGTVRDRPFGDIWTDEFTPRLRASREREEYFTGNCADCQYQDICRGASQLRALSDGDDPFASDPQLPHARGPRYRQRNPLSRGHRLIPCGRI